MLYEGALPVDFVEGSPIFDGPTVEEIAEALVKGTTVTFFTEKRPEGVRVILWSMKCYDSDRKNMALVGEIDVGDGEKIEVQIRYWIRSVIGGILRAKEVATAKAHSAH